MNMRAIAAKAGVSTATVSRVISGSPLVKEETALRVRKVLEEADFVPNPIATTLKYGRSRTFGLIIPDISNPFFSEFLGAFEELVVPMDHEVLLTSVQSPEMLLKSIRRMLTRQVDGVVMMGSEYDTKAIEPLLLHRIPLVTVDRKTTQTGCSDVAVDFDNGFLECVLHLRDLGHTRIGYVGGLDGPRTSQVRANAFRSAITKAGLNYYPELTCAGDFRLSGGEVAAPKLMTAALPPTAIVTANDMTAFGVIRSLQKLGLSVPGDVSVTGLDDVLFAQAVSPALTTIRIPRKRLARACVDALNHAKENLSERGQQFHVTTELIIRESTGFPQYGNGMTLAAADNTSRTFQKQLR